MCSVRETLSSYEDPTVMFQLQRELAVKEERFEDARQFQEHIMHEMTHNRYAAVWVQVAADGLSVFTCTQSWRVWHSTCRAMITHGMLPCTTEHTCTAATCAPASQDDLAAAAPSACSLQHPTHQAATC
jgi:hypothetical protein